jgi:hypothetical protein
MPPGWHAACAGGRMRIVVALLLSLLASPALAQQGLLCRSAIQAAEREAGLPAHLLTAIARVESGRRDPETGAFHPWPWTINAEGRGQFFPTRAAAVAAVQQLWAQGVRSIDVGCMQINLRHHPNAFANLELAFDPLTNARYAARFLTELNSSRNDWTRAASAYHSATPEFADPYRQRVMAAWVDEQARPFPRVTMLASGAAAVPVRGQIPRPAGGGGQMLSNGADRIGVPNGAVTGRTLDAYRSVPVPVVSRPAHQVQIVPATLAPMAIRAQRPLLMR